MVNLGGPFNIWYSWQVKLDRKFLLLGVVQVPVNWTSLFLGIVGFSLNTMGLSGSWLGNLKNP
jgi:hypothetical protein